MLRAWPLPLQGRQQQPLPLPGIPGKSYNKGSSSSSDHPQRGRSRSNRISLCRGMVMLSQELLAAGATHMVVRPTGKMTQSGYQGPARRIPSASRQQQTVVTRG